MSKSPQQRLFARRADAPIWYWFPHRWLDSRAGKVDGKAGLLSDQLDNPEHARRQLDPPRGLASADGAGHALTLIEPSAVVSLTPYLGTLDRRYRGQSEKAVLLLNAATSVALSELLAINQRLPPTEERLRAAREELQSLPREAPSEYLQRRNSVERGADDALVTTRNQRDWEALIRRPALEREQQASIELASLRQRQAALTGEISVLRRVAATRIRRLREHALRRGRTYERRLVLHHPSGSQLLSLLGVGRPDLPDWVRWYGTDQDDLKLRTPLLSPQEI